MLSFLNSERESALPICMRLNCNYNELTVLPNLPKCQHLYCTHNKLTLLPALPALRVVACEGNPYIDYTQEFATRFRLPFPSPRMISDKNKGALISALSPSSKGGLTAKDITPKGAFVPNFLLTGKERSVFEFLGGNIPLKFKGDITSIKSTHYPFLLNL